MENVLSVQYGKLLNGKFFVDFCYMDKEENDESSILCGNEYTDINDALVVANALVAQYGVPLYRSDEQEMDEKFKKELSDENISVSDCKLFQFVDGPEDKKSYPLIKVIFVNSDGKESIEAIIEAPNEDDIDEDDAYNIMCQASENTAGDAYENVDFYLDELRDSR